MKFAVIGHPVGHSLSPRMHAANIRALGRTDEYVAFDVPPEELGARVARFVAEGYRGFNVTVPHKETIRAFLTRLDASAEAIGAVNTVRIEADGSTTGFNTDAAGFRAPLDAAGFDWSRARVLVLGAGGAARAVCAAALGAGCASLTVANRTAERAAALANDWKAKYAKAAIGWTAWELVDGAAADLVVNATCVGLKPTDGPVREGKFFHAGETVYDLAPVPRETATCAVARAAGARVLGGLDMLVAQGAAAFEIWTGQHADAGAMRAVL